MGLVSFMRNINIKIIKYQKIYFNNNVDKGHFNINKVNGLNLTTFKTLDLLPLYSL